MSSSKVKCVLNLIEDHFGSAVEQIANQLIINGPLNLKSIGFFSKRSVHQIKECLKTLIQHNLVKFKTNNRDQVEYELITDNVIAILRYPKYVLVANHLDSRIGEDLVYEFLKNGKLTLNELIEKLLAKLSNDSRFQDKYELPKLIYDAFVKFVNQDYFMNDEQNKNVPIIDFKKFYSLAIVKQEQDEELEKPKTKKLKTGTEDDSTSSNGESIVWYINNEQFDNYLRAELVADCIKSHYDDSIAGEIAKIIFSCRQPMTRGQIINQAIELELCDNVNEVDSYLKLFDQDLNNRFIYRVESTSDGGRFDTNEYNIFYYLIKETFSTIVNDYYGDKSSRIFRLLLIKKYLQQKTIGELAMISVKDAKERLSTLFKDGLVRILQYSKAPDYAPMKTSFVITVDLNELCLMFRNKCYHSLYSTSTRRNHEYSANRTLIEKKLLIDAIIENLEGTNERAQINDLDQTFSSHEKAIINRYEMITRKTELSELECERTLFLIDTFLSLKATKKE